MYPAKKSAKYASLECFLVSKTLSFARRVAAVVRVRIKFICLKSVKREPFSRNKFSTRLKILNLDNWIFITSLNFINWDIEGLCSTWFREERISNDSIFTYFTIAAETLWFYTILTYLLSRASPRSSLLPSSPPPPPRRAPGAAASSSLLPSPATCCTSTTSSPPSPTPRSSSSHSRHCTAFGRWYSNNMINVDILKDWFFASCIIIIRQDVTNNLLM